MWSVPCFDTVRLTALRCDTDKEVTPLKSSLISSPLCWPRRGPRLLGLSVTSISDQFVSSQQFSGHGVDFMTVLQSQARICHLLWLTLSMCRCIAIPRCCVQQVVAAFKIPLSFRAHTTGVRNNNCNTNWWHLYVCNNDSLHFFVCVSTALQCDAKTTLSTHGVWPSQILS